MEQLFPGVPGRRGILAVHLLGVGWQQEKKPVSSAGDSAGLTGMKELFVAHCQRTAVRNNGDLADSGAFG